MKTKLLAVTMMGLATLGSLGSVAMGAGAGGGGYTPSVSTTVDNSANAGLSLNEGYTKGVGLAGAGSDEKEGLVDVVKNAINWILGILALIVFILLLWGGFQMVTAAGDDKKYQAGFTILKQAGIGLAFIACSWLIVTLIFYVISVSAGTTANTKG